MAAQILDGKIIAERVRSEVAVRAAAFEQKTGRKAGLEVVLVGDDAASQVYVASKERSTAQLGMRGAVHRLPADVSQRALLDKVAALNASPEVDGILVQLPLPKGLDGEATVHAIDPAKDVDGLHPFNAGLLVAGGKGLRPCTPSGCLRMLDETGLSLAGKRAIVIGRSNLVGKPVALMLLERSCTVTMAHSKTVDLDERVRESDIVVAAVGVPELVKGDWIKPGAVVIDVGVNRIAPKKLVGDVEFAAARERASWITPVPGGVGLMTVAMLMQNTLEAAERRAF
ncbi:MAG: bifunctional methylenetetrahydrofolate dehydrogenase/methenyltetrahydrofolate cyclohydrolase FolD [Polyangiales bacterium]